MGYHAAYDKQHTKILQLVLDVHGKVSPSRHQQTRTMVPNEASLVHAQNIISYPEKDADRPLRPHPKMTTVLLEERSVALNVFEGDGFCPRSSAELWAIHQ